MSPEIKAQFKADLARVRYERDQYRKRASERRKAYHDLKKRRRFLDALDALDRYQEYRDTAAHYASEVDRLRKALA